MQSYLYTFTLTKKKQVEIKPVTNKIKKMTCTIRALFAKTLLKKNGNRCVYVCVVVFVSDDKIYCSIFMQFFGCFLLVKTKIRWRRTFNSNLVEWRCRIWGRHLKCLFCLIKWILFFAVVHERQKKRNGIDNKREKCKNLVQFQFSSVFFQVLLFFVSMWKRSEK